MTLPHFTTRAGARLALGALATAAATTALVGVSTGVASAATVTSSITCSVSGSPIGTFPVSVTASIPGTAEAGFPVPAGLLGYTAQITIPDALAPLIAGATSPDYAVNFGANKLVAPFTVTSVTNNPDATSTANAVGANSAVVLPKAGSYTVTLPSSFSVSTGAGTATCTDAAPPSLGSITLSKQVSSVKATVAKSVKAGAKVKVKVKVSGDKAAKGGVLPTGKVLVKDGKKTVGSGKLKKGKVTVTIKLGRGSHTLTVLYKGDGYVAKSTSKAVSVSAH